MRVKENFELKNKKRGIKVTGQDSYFFEVVLKKRHYTSHFIHDVGKNGKLKLVSYFDTIRAQFD